MPASLAACVPVFIGAVAGHRHQLPFRLLFFDEAHFRLRGRLGQEIIDTGFAGDGRRGAGIVSSNHHCADAHSAEALEAFLDPTLHDVFQVNDPEHTVPLRNRKGRPAAVADPVGNSLDFGRRTAAERFDVHRDRVNRAFADDPAVEVAPAHARLGAEGNEVDANLFQLAPA